MDQQESDSPLAKQEDQTIELTASSVLQSSTFSGPLPPPEALTQYENVLPGAAERIFQMAERELRHRQSIEGTIVNGDSRRAYLGIALGTLVALCALGAAAYAISQGEAWVGGGIAVVDIGSIVGAYIYGTRTRQVVFSSEPEAAAARDVETTQG